MSFKLGLDFYDTITVAPKIYRKLAQSILAADGEVHIITAVFPKNQKKVTQDIRRSHVPYTQTHIVAFTNYLDVPKLKAQKARELRLDMFIDDRKDTCERMYNKRILAVQSLGEVA
jgi:hypothetical protein